MKRRDFMLGMAAAPAAALPLPAAADDAQLLALVEEWRAVIAAGNATRGLSDEEMEARFWSRRDRLEEEIKATPARTVRGALARLRMALEGSDWDLDHGSVYRRYAEQALAELEFASKGATR